MTKVGVGVLPLVGAGGGVVVSGGVSPPGVIGSPLQTPDTVTQFAVGDLVQICTDMDRMKVYIVTADKDLVRMKL